MTYDARSPIDEIKINDQRNKTCNPRNIPDLHIRRANQECEIGKHYLLRQSSQPGFVSMTPRGGGDEHPDGGKDHAQCRSHKTEIGIVLVNLKFVFGPI